MDVLKASRTQHRRLFSRACNEFETNEATLSTEENISKLKLIEEKAKLMIAVEEQIRQMLLEDAEIGSDILEKQIDESETYLDRWRILEQKLISHQNSVNELPAASSLINPKLMVPQTLLHYPKIKLPTFDGNVRNWLGFWGQFEKIDKDTHLDAHDKFAYLSQAMESGTPAEELIKSFPPGGKSYEKALKQLHTRYGRDELLIDVYVRDLLSLVLQKHNSVKRNSLRKLYDQLETRLRALETLGVTRDKNAAMLFPLVESALPDETLRAWERYRSAHRRSKGEVIDEEEQNTEYKHKTDLDHILCFLQDEVEGEERISLATRSFTHSKDENTCSKRRNYNSKTGESIVPSAADLFTSSQGGINSCIFCSNSHSSWDCFKARKMSMLEKQAAVEKAHCCFLCLKSGHGVKKCKVKTGCMLCGKRHHLLLCRNLPQSNKIADSKKRRDLPSSEPIEAHQDEALANISKSPTVMLQTLIVTLRGHKNKRMARAIIDSASQRSYILKRTAREMGYEPTGKEHLRHSLFGGTNTGVCDHDIYTIYLSNTSQTYNCHFEALSQQVICETIPPVGEGLGLQELSECGIYITDCQEGPIEILIGADIAGKLMTGGFKRLSSGLSAVETKLGWTVMGKIPFEKSNQSAALVVTSMLTKDAVISDLWALESLGILDPSEKKSKEELQKASREHFLNTVKVDETNRFVVHLPWLDDHPPLPDNYDLAVKRLESTVKRLDAESLFVTYDNVFKEWENEGIIEEVPESELEFPCHYLPHRHVVKENSTTKIRPVFDASAKKKGSSSLNDCLEKGMNLIELIPSIVTRFRMKKIGITSDIRKAFLQIGLYSKDKNYLRFIWYNENGKLKYFRHCRVVFGVSCSPFLLGSVIQYHLDTTLINALNGNRNYPVNVVQQLVNSFYVDNCLTSVEDENKLNEFIQVATAVMAERKFDLRGWEYSDINCQNVEPTNILGMLWERGSDTLSLNLTTFGDCTQEKISKRIVLAAVHKIFDPLGIASAVTLYPKLLLQTLWKSKLTWDEDVDPDTKVKFLKWVKNLEYLNELKIPRWLEGDKGVESIHFFCDASKLAYSAVVYIRVCMEDTVRVHLVRAKTRITPCGRKETTIARLELLAATITARLSSDVLKEFDTSNVYFWTDSTTVLSWLNREGPWGIFVQNRVQEIRQLTPIEAWRHIPGSMNPADLPSRGCSARHLLASKWWEGPKWLYLPQKDWPSTEFVVNEDIVASEKKKNVISSLLTVGICNSLGTRFSNYRKTVRVIAWVRRFIHNCRSKQKACSEFTAHDLESAEKTLIRLIQIEAFEETNDKRLRSLSAFYEDGIVRIKTGVLRRDDEEEFKTPAVLPGEHPIVKSLIMEEHKKRGHAGVSYVLNSLREKYWLLCGRRYVRSVLRNCVVCKRHSAISVNPPTAPPPADRVQDAHVFQVTGVDFAGPLILRDKSKAWICLFTCAVYRAVHLELVTSMSTETFIQAFHRFVSRRGRPSTVYSDNGTNLTGAANIFALIDFDVVTSEAKEEQITWKFIPPGAPWWGGWWERLVGMMKQILKKILGRASLCYEEMLTVLCDCEAILNGRPLTAVTSDTELTVLTPSNFLKEIKSDRVPDIIPTLDSNSLCRRLIYVQTVREAFRKRFRQEYLGALITKRKDSRICCVKPGDIVLVGSGDKKKLFWPLGLVTELLPGADGVSRRARVKTQKGELIRALQNLYPLEVSSVVNLPEQELKKSVVSLPELKPEKFETAAKTVSPKKPKEQTDYGTGSAPKELKTSRVGRKIKPPEKLSL